MIFVWLCTTSSSQRDLFTKCDFFIGYCLLLWLIRVQEHGGEPIIPFSGVFERNLCDMPEDEAAKYCDENKVQRLVTIPCSPYRREKMVASIYTVHKWRVFLVF